MIKVKNISSSNVTLICTPLHFRRPLTPSREIALTREVYDELSFDPGFQTLVEIGILKVSGAEEENAAVIESSMTSLSRDEIKKIFEEKNYAEFAKTIQDVSPATKESIIVLRGQGFNYRYTFYSDNTYASWDQFYSHEIKIDNLDQELRNIKEISKEEYNEAFEKMIEGMIIEHKNYFNDVDKQNFQRR